MWRKINTTLKDEAQKSEKPGSRTMQKAGGREFGNVIEPTQAQMASGNKGLAGDSGNRSSGTGSNRMTHRKKPAA